MPFTSTPDPIIASLTNIARTNFARASIGDISFTMTDFAVGRGGYQMVDPVLITTIDTSATTLDDQFFPTTPTLQPIEGIEYPTPKTAVIDCRLDQTDAVAGLGELGIWATVLDSSIPSEIGTQFLAAIVHFPLSTKTLKQIVVYRVIIQF